MIVYKSKPSTCYKLLALIVLCFISNNHAYIARSIIDVHRHKKTDISMRPFTQVISDVDDTLKSSGGIKIGDIALGGIDKQYNRGEFYPGVFQFMLELSLSSIMQQPPALATDEMLYPPKVAVLTARAVELKAALELKEDSKLAREFKKAGEGMGIKNWGLGPVLYGSVAVSMVIHNQ